MRLIDLSSDLYSGMMRLPIFPDVEIAPILSTARGDGANVSEVRLPTHAGTHVDAPFHFVPGRKTIDQVNLEQLCGPAIGIPVHRQADEAIPPQDLASYDVRAGDIVLLHTGWSEKFETPEYQRHPYLLPDTAHWLVERQVKMVGIDGVNVDMPIVHRPTDYGSPVHHILLGHDVLIIENLTNLKAISGRRVQLYAFPLKVRGGDGAPARVVAQVN